MSLLVPQQHNLPANIEDLTKFVLIGREKLVSVRAEIRAIDKLGLAQEVRQQKLSEAQAVSEAVLDAEVKIGVLTMGIPKKERIRTDLLPDTAGVQTKTKVVSDLGLSLKTVERCEKLAQYPEIVEQVKAEAREADDIVSRSVVLDKIKIMEREEKRREHLVSEPEPFNGKYDVIYADPPWEYAFSVAENRAIKNHYPTMSDDEIKSVEIPATDNAVLFMWSTAPKLTTALEVMEKWGFSYKSHTVWDKEIIGMGYWSRGQHELLLIGTKGEYSPPPPALRVSSVYKEQRRKHSRKPDYYYDLIERMFPNGKYLELFARKQHNEKWTVWGNQVT